VSYKALANIDNNYSINKVKRETIASNNDCQYIASFLDQLGVDVNNCCDIYGISCNRNGRITKMYFFQKKYNII